MKNAATTVARMFIVIASISCVLCGFFSCSCIYDLTLNENLYDAVQQGDVPEMKRLLALGANPNFEFDGGSPTLVAAVLSRNPQAVKLLLDHGANPNVRDSDGQRVLKTARYLPEIRKMLKAAGAKE